MEKVAAQSYAIGDPLLPGSHPAGFVVASGAHAVRAQNILYQLRSRFLSRRGKLSKVTDMDLWSAVSRLNGSIGTNAPRRRSQGNFSILVGVDRDSTLMSTGDMPLECGANHRSPARVSASRRHRSPRPNEVAPQTGIVIDSPPRWRGRDGAHAIVRVLHAVTEPTDCRYDVRGAPLQKL